MAIMSGELSNSSTYPSSFAKIHKDRCGELGQATVMPWDFEKRISDVGKVEIFKSKTTNRTKVTSYIASLESRQEFLPPIGRVIYKSLIDPLHMNNNTWEKVNELILGEAIIHSKAVKSKKLAELQADDPISVYSKSLQKDVKAGKVH